MEQLFKLSGNAVILCLVVSAISAYLLWLFIKSAVSAGVEEGILRAIKSEKEHPTKTDKELLDEELSNW